MTTSCNNPLMMLGLYLDALIIGQKMQYVTFKYRKRMNFTKGIAKFHDK